MTRTARPKNKRVIADCALLFFVPFNSYCDILIPHKPEKFTEYGTSPSKIINRIGLQCFFSGKLLMGISFYYSRMFHNKP